MVGGPPAHAVAAGAGRPADGTIVDGLRDLHQGLYARADESFRSAELAAPGDPEPLLFRAYGFYWRILEDPKVEDQDAAFRSATEACLAAAEARLEAAPGVARVEAAAGMAHILRSHIEALRRGYFRAGQEARRGKKLLEQALEDDPGLTDALFPLGTYNYFADKVPALVKGLRVFLFLPGGDADQGLAQLRAVATSGSRLRTDARMVLAAICGSREERCYRGAITHLEVALHDNPGSPLILGWLGGLQVRLGRYDEAARSFEEALRGATGVDPDRVRQRRRLRLFLAEALAADWRLDHAEAVLRAARQEAAPLPDSDRRLLGRVEGEIASKRGAGLLAQDPAAPDGGGGPPDGAPAPASAQSAALAAAFAEALAVQEERGPAGALAAFKDLAGGRPRAALPHFLLGRALFLGGRYEEAEAELGAALDLTDDPPAWMEGWAELYRGMALERLGDARRARSHLRRAGDIKRFRSAERALLELEGDEPPQVACGP